MVKIKLTMPEHTRFGSALFKFWYFNSDLQTVGDVKIMGSPHSGGEHTLFVVSERWIDILSWLDLFVEAYPFVQDEIHFLKKEIRSNRVAGGIVNVVSIKAVLAVDAPHLLWVWMGNEKRFVEPGTDQPWTEAGARTKALMLKKRG